MTCTGWGPLTSKDMQSSLGDTQEGPMEYSMLSGVTGQCKRIKGNIVNIASHFDFRPKEGGKLGDFDIELKTSG